MTDVLQPPPGVDDFPWPDDIPRYLALDEFLAWYYECVHAEWVDGELIALSPVHVAHLRIRMFLGFVIGDRCRDHGQGDIFFVPIRLHLPSRPSVREPDLVFISAAHEDRIKDTYIEGPADLVIEITASDSEARDRATKFAEYEEAGIPEYWLIDPLRHEVVFNLLGEDGRYHPGVVSQGGVYASRMLEGFRLRPDWLWREPLPTPAAALAELPA